MPLSSRMIRPANTHFILICSVFLPNSFPGEEKRVPLLYTDMCDRHTTKAMQILYIALFLLISGEAANLRLMPDSLAYIFYNVSLSLYSEDFSPLGLLDSAWKN